MIRSLISLCLISLIPFLFLSNVFARQPVLSEVRIEATLATLQKETLADLIPLKKGDPYTPEGLEKILESLRQTGLFEKVEAETKRGRGGVVLTFRLVEARPIRKIKVSGQTPYLSKRILRLSALQPGDPFQEALLEESRQRIIEFFLKEGYFDTKVTIAAKDDIPSGMVNLEIDIDKGKRRRVGAMEIDGNTQFNPARLRNRIGAHGKYKPSLAKKRLKRLERTYIKKGFVRARTRLTQAVPNPQTGRVDITIKITERKKLILRFEGNRWFKPQSLDDVTTFTAERGYDPFAVERSVEKMLQFYRLNGFPDAAIDTSVEKSENTVVVNFLISEGPRVRVKKIDFQGNKSFSDKKLTEVMETEEHSLTKQGFYKEEPVPRDLERVAKFYRDNGFFDMAVTDWRIERNREGDLVTITADLEEGKPSLLSGIEVEGAESLPPFEIEAIFKKTNLKEGERYSEKAIAMARKKMAAWYYKNGFAHATITSDKMVDTKGPSVRLHFSIEEGPLVKIGEIVVTGHYLTEEKVIRGTLKFKTGDIYTYKKVLDAQLNLKRLGIFDFVTITPLGLEEKRGEVNLVVKVQESKSLVLDIQAGFDSDKLGSGQILFTKRNIFGLAKQFQIRAVGGFEFDRGEATFYSPRIWGASWNLVNQYFIQYEDDENFNATSYGGSLGTLKNFGPDWSILLKQQVTRFNIFEDESNSIALQKNLFDSVFSETILSAAYDTRDNYADPQRGIYALVATEFDTDLANIGNIFNISRFNLSHYQGLMGRFTLINNLRLGKLLEISDSPRIPATKLFFMGGNDTLRGFDEDAINSSGGGTSVIYNAELHFRLVNSIKLAGFFDMGSLTDTFSEITTESFRESAGIGLRYITPVGPIRLDYGFVLDKRANEPASRFHFSFGYFF